MVAAEAVVVVKARGVVVMLEGPFPMAAVAAVAMTSAIYLVRYSALFSRACHHGTQNRCEEVAEQYA